MVVGRLGHQPTKLKSKSKTKIGAPMELNSDDIAIFLNEGETAKEGILLMENATTVDDGEREDSSASGAIKIKQQQQQNHYSGGGAEDDGGDQQETEASGRPNFSVGLTVKAKLEGNLLALWNLDDSSLLTGRHQTPPPPQFLLVLERAVAQLCEPTPTLPYAFSITFPFDDSTTTTTMKNEQFRFSAFSEQDRSEWVQAIAACSHELLVARIRASADSMAAFDVDGEDNEEKELAELAKRLMAAKTDDAYAVQKQTLVRAPPFVEKREDILQLKATTSASSSSAASSSSSSSSTGGDLSPLEPDGDSGAFPALYCNCLTKKLSLETGRGVIRIREDMAEPKVSLIVPPSILDICIRGAGKAIDHLSDVFYLPANWEPTRSLHLKRLKQFRDRLESLRKILTDYDGPPFKPSRSKEAPNMAPIPTNLHLQRFSVWDSSRAFWYSHDFFTSGCFTAYSEGFADGGARRTRQKLRQYVASTATTIAGSNNNNVIGAAASDYDFARITLWQSELNGVGQRVEQLKLRLQRWAPNSVDELRNVGKFAAEIRTLSEQLRQLCDSIPRIQSIINELAAFYRSYETAAKTIAAAATNANNGKGDSNGTISGTVPSAPVTTGEFSMETLESQRDDFQAELACLITKVENLLQIDDDTFAEAAGAESKSWIDSFRAASHGVILRIGKLRRSISDGLFYGMLCALPTPETSALHYGLLYRHVIILSQALTSIVAALLHDLWMTDGERLERRVSSWTRCGALVCIHSYLSCYESENGMIEDMAEVTRLLREYCAFRVAKSFAGVRNCASPLVEGEYGQFKITLPVPDRVWSRLPDGLRRGEWFYLVPCYWNVGINHAQTLASKLGGVALEAEVNEVAYKTARGYVKRLSSTGVDEKTCERAGTLLDEMCKMLCTNETKNVRLLEKSSQLCRTLNGALFVCCKSGKDRTSMAVTLEEALLLECDYGMPRSHFQATLDALRRDGTRLENTFKNIGARQYAFSAFQLPFLPDSYRPPKGTHGKAQT